ncbi:MAG: signal peptidase II, partial [Hydrogeniiclostridium sp.]
MPFLMIGLAVVLAVVDQILKYIVVQNLKPIGSYSLIPGLLDFTYVENRGAAFGILSNQRWFFIITTAILMIAILILLFRYHHHTGLT